MTKTVKLGLFGIFRCIRVHSGVAAPFHAPGITETNGKRFEDLNVKLVPRVFLDGNDGTGLDPAGNLPCARFSVANYFTGGRHPIGQIGAGMRLAAAEWDPATFDDPGQDRTLRYALPEGR